jgi:hypothetical protein
MQKATVVKICIFCNDCIGVVRGVCLHLGIWGRLKPEFPNVSCLRIGFGESLNQ